MLSLWSAREVTSAKRRKTETGYISTQVEGVVDSRVKELLFASENSSRHRPGLAHLHNEALKSTKGKNLFTIPIWLRNKILRMALVNDKSIIVSAKYLQLSMEPGLLSVSHDIRALARPMFYCENNFKFKVRKFNALVLQPWTKTFSHVTEVEAEAEVKYHERVMRLTGPSESQYTDPYYGRDLDNLSAGQDWILAYQKKQTKKVLDDDVAERGNHGWEVSFNPHWHNLVDWLRLSHTDMVGAYQPHYIDVGAERAVQGVFELVEGRRGDPWRVVSLMLPCIRKTLAGSDERWLLEPHEVEDDQRDDDDEKAAMEEMFGKKKDTKKEAADSKAEE